ncbi:MAG TPA: hypothetical protein VFG11_10410 [Acidobacteriota bacterium]|nr:hypothetical protein [Acidobacteriota bacterium]
MNRFAILILFLLLGSTPLCGYTLVFRSGKTVHGRLVRADADRIQIADPDGTVLSVRKDQLNWSATVAANRDEPAESAGPATQPSTAITVSRPESLADIAEQSRKNRKGNVRMFTNQDLYGVAVQMPSLHHHPAATRNEAEAKLAEAKREYGRWAEECRGAGADQPAGGSGETKGADPSSIANAKQICAHAIRAKFDLDFAVQDLARFDATDSATNQE